MVVAQGWRFLMVIPSAVLGFFFFNDTATTEIYTLSLHDALPISGLVERREVRQRHSAGRGGQRHLALQPRLGQRDRKSTRLNSSHSQISYAVFCLKKKKLGHYILVNQILHRSIGHHLSL